MIEVKQGAAKNLMIFMTDVADHITGKTGLTLTVTASKDGGAFASITPTVTERGSGWYNLALTAGHTDTLGDLCLHATASGADPADLKVNVVANVEADSYARLGAPAGASVSADIAAVKTDSGGLRTDYTTTKAGYLDAAVSSRLAAAGYTAPDNTSIGTLLTRVPSEVAQKSHLVNGTGNLTPPVNTGIWDRVDAAVSSRASATDYTAVRAAKLDNLDVSVGSRLAASGYTAPDNTTIGFIQKWILNKLVEGPSNTWKLYDDDSTTVLKTWTWDPTTTTRSKAV